MSKVLKSIIFIHILLCVLFVIVHHKMSCNVPDGHFHVLYFLKVNSMLFTMVKTIFKLEDLWPS